MWSYNCMLCYIRHLSDNILVFTHTNHIHVYTLTFDPTPPVVRQSLGFPLREAAQALDGGLGHQAVLPEHVEGAAVIYRHIGV